MDLDDNQIKQIKEQLLSQIENFPSDKKAQAKAQIESMNAEQLEQFLKENGMVNEEGEETQQCVFCALANGKMPSTKIGENSKAIAILELNPISPGHALIIPKEHITKGADLDKETKELAVEISKLIQKKMQAKNIIIENSNIMGHESINILPVYENETMKSKRNKQTPEGLAQIKSQIETKEKEIIKEPEKQKEEINEKNTWLPKRLP